MRRVAELGSLDRYDTISTMKRKCCIVGWVATALVIAFLATFVLQLSLYFFLGLLFPGKVVSEGVWDSAVLGTIVSILYDLVFYGIVALGIICAWRGKLPGTQRSKPNPQDERAI